MATSSGSTAAVGEAASREVLVERLDPRALQLAPVVVQVVAGDLEQPAAQGLDRAAEPGQPLKRSLEHLAGEVLGLVAVADGGHEEAEQNRGVGSIDPGHGGRLAAARASQVGRCQAISAEPLLFPPGPEHLPPSFRSNVTMRLSDQLDSD